MIKIDNTDIEELSIYKTMRDNAFDELHSFVADSPKVVNLLLKTDIEVKSLLATQDYYDEFKDLVSSKNIETLYVSTKEEMQKIVGHKIHHNVMMHGIRPKQTSLDTMGDTIIMLDEISSTENIGAIARSSAGLGVDGYLLPNQGPHPYGRRALRVSMGYVTSLNTHLYNDIFQTIANLKLLGYKVYGAELTPDATPLRQVKAPHKWVLIMGHEGTGLSSNILDICDEVISIEISEDVKSFNVAVAASIILYQLKT